MTTATPRLHLAGVRSGYGDTEVLHGVTIEVDEGETVVILGPNGHGKTTLLRTISGLLPVRGGEIDFAGTRLNGRAPDAIVGLGVLHIPQSDLLFPEMTVRENLLMGAYRAEAWAHRQSRLDELFAFFPRLEERQKQLARTLSGGERRMLAIGRGLMGEGRLLMIDEPSLGLAPVISEELYRRIGEIKASGRAILLVEESAAHVEALADRVYLLESGLIVREGEPRALLADAALLRTYLGVG
ncbi:MAG: ABC transporter ATP-binding protein [Thermomicrobiales bacterium]